MLIIDMQATGRNIKKMIADKGINMKQMQDAFGFQTPQAIYKWYRGAAMPTIDNLVILASLLQTTLDSIVIVNR